MPFRDEGIDQLEHLGPTIGIEPVRRLVEDQQLGPMRDRLGELDALAHAGRVALDGPVARLAQPHAIERLVCRSACLGRLEPAETPGQRDVAHTVEPGQEGR